MATLESIQLSVAKWNEIKRSIARFQTIDSNNNLLFQLPEILDNCANNNFMALCVENEFQIMSDRSSLLVSVTPYEAFRNYSERNIWKYLLMIGVASLALSVSIESIPRTNL